MFRGNYSATLDERGRIRIPGAFLSYFRDNYSDDLFLTSIYGDCMRIYPLEVWVDIEKKLLKIPSMNTSRSRLLGRMTFFGQSGRLDKVGRVLVPQRLRTLAGLEGEVAVLGHLEYLEVWSPDKYMTKMESEPLTEEDKQFLSDLGI